MAKNPFPRFTIRSLPGRTGVVWALLIPLLPAATDYEQTLKPLFRERCYGCHGALKQKAGLRMDTVAGMLRGGETGPALVKGDAAASLLLQRIITPDPDDRMPPEHEGERFNAAQAGLVRHWIDAGAPAPPDESPEPDPADHWAFRPLRRPGVPVLPNPAWARNPIDAFVARQHHQHGLTPQPEAPPEVLLRRLYIDLIGLPPPPGALAALTHSPAADWFETLTRQLLQDPRHAEREARHWMDIWRYSDWWGLGDQLRNSQKHLWHWRDWIVESLHAGLPYDEMIRQMLAADELYPGDLDKIRATGFLARNFFLFNRNPWMEETVEHVGKGLLGLTMNCSKCHDHKFDPIPQSDYYRLRAVFEPYQVRLDAVAGESNLAHDGIPRVFDGLPGVPTWRYIRGDEGHPDKSSAVTPGVPAFLASFQPAIQPVKLPPEAWQPERQPWVLDSHLAAARRQLNEALDAASRAMKPPGVKVEEESPAAAVAMAEQTVAGQRVAAAAAAWESTRLRAAAMRATWDQLPDAPQQRRHAVQAERQAATAVARLKLEEAGLNLAKASPDKKAAAEKDREAAHQSLTETEKSLARPVKPDEEFTPLPGAQWTPTRFLDSTRDDPPVPFPDYSTGRRRALAAWITDPRNPLTARVAVNHLWTRHMGTPLVATTFDFGRNGAPPTHPELLDWLASELIDSGWNLKHLHFLIVNSATWRLSSSSRESGENPIRDPDNTHLWRRSPLRLEAEVIRDSLLALSGELDPTRGGPPVPPAGQPASKRRSLYFFGSNNERNLFLTTFDAAAVKECYRRDQSIVPQQALALTNSQLVQETAGKIAARLAEPDDATFIRIAFAEILGSIPNDSETDACSRALEAWRALPSGSEASARSQLVLTLLNHNDFVTLR